MERYSRCLVIVDAEKVNRLIKFKFNTIEAYLQKYSISRQRLWDILNRPHSSKNAKCLQDLANNLEVSIDTILL